MTTPASVALLACLLGVASRASHGGEPVTIAVEAVEADVLLSMLSRLHVSTLAGESNLAQFYSAEARALEIDFLLSSVDAEGAMRVFRNRLRFMENIGVVYEASILPVQQTGVPLRILYAKWDGCPLREMELHFVRENGSWLINQVHHYLVLPRTTAREKIRWRFADLGKRGIPTCPQA